MKTKGKEKTKEPLIEEWQRIFDAISDLIFIQDKDFTIIKVNKAFADALKLKAEDIIGKKCYELLHKSNVPWPECPFARTKKDKKIHTQEVNDPNTCIPLLITTSPILIDKGEVIRSVHIAKDITEQKKADEALRTREVQLRNIVEKNPDGMIVLDKNGMALFLNQAATSLFGRKREDLLGSSFGFPVVIGEATEIDIIRGGKTATAEMRVVEIEWEEQPAHLASIRDITERKRAEQLRAEINERKQLDQLKDEFVSTVSHELRTPLTTMKEFVSIVLDEIPGKINKDQKEYLSIVKGNIDRLARIIASLLDISKIEARRMELRRTLVNIVGLAKDVVITLKARADAKHIRLKTSFPRATSDIYIDPDRITQVFTNLIDNAIKFTPEGGTVAVDIRARKKEIECSVSDTGIGITPENRDKVFEKFQQIGRTAGPGPKGTGLGLPITKELTQMHKGRIWVESEVGKGSKFTFTLPKISSEVIFKEYISNGIKEAMDKGTKLSIIVISIGDYREALRMLGKRSIKRILRDLEEITKKTLRRTTDTVVKDTGEMVALLQDVEKAGALAVKGRLEDSVKKYIQKKKSEIQINLGTATFPDEAKNDEEIINKAKTQSESLYTGPGGRKSRRKRIENKKSKS